MDSTDCFILDAGAKIYVYMGSGSSAFEKQKATSLAETMEAERGGRSERVDSECANCSEACRRSLWVSLKTPFCLVRCSQPTPTFGSCSAARRIRSPRRDPVGPRRFLRRRSSIRCTTKLTSEHGLGTSAVQCLPIHRQRMLCASLTGYVDACLLLVRWELVKTGTLSTGDLRSDDVMLIDCVSTIPRSTHFRRNSGAGIAPW